MDPIHSCPAILPFIFPKLDPTATAAAAL
jgi:hypothetical protein